MRRAHWVGSGLVVALALTSPVVLAQQVDVACPRLDPEATQELRARARLTLRALDPEDAPGTVTVHCTPASAWLEWVGPPAERLAIDERAGLVEGALEALERRAPPATEPSPAQDEPPPRSTAPDVGEPEVAPPPRASRRPARDRAVGTGGLGLGLVLEPRPGSLAFGPRLDVGYGAGGFAFVVMDTLRIAPADSTLLWGFAAGLAWGAPFTSDEWLGAVAAVGLDGLAGVGRDASADATTSDSSPVVQLGVRAATQVGAFSLWSGVDAGWRSQRLRLDEPYEVSLPQWFVGVSVGALLLVDPGVP